MRLNRYPQKYSLIFYCNSHLFTYLTAYNVFCSCFALPCTFCNQLQLSQVTTTSDYYYIFFFIYVYFQPVTAVQIHLSTILLARCFRNKRIGRGRTCVLGTDAKETSKKFRKFKKACEVVDDDDGGGEW